MQIEDKNSLPKKELFQLSKHVVLKKALLANKMPLKSRKYFGEYEFVDLHKQTQRPKTTKQRTRIEIRKDATINLLILITLATTILLSWII